MDVFVSNLKNYWYYYKIPVGICLLVLIVGGYLALQSARISEADYDIGLITTTPRSDSALAALTDAIAVKGTDRNGDGQVLVRLHPYYVDLADDSPNAGVTNADKIAALDADLIGNVSGIFLTEAPEVLNSVTNGLMAEPYLPYHDGLYLCIRTNAADHYRTLLECIF